jgi:hypothetical protein
VPKVDFLSLTISLLPLASLWEKFLTSAGAELYSIYVHVMGAAASQCEAVFAGEAELLLLLANTLTEATGASCSTPSPASRSSLASRL